MLPLQLDRPPGRYDALTAEVEIVNANVIIIVKVIVNIIVIVNESLGTSLSAPAPK